MVPGRQTRKKKTAGLIESRRCEAELVANHSKPGLAAVDII